MSKPAVKPTTGRIVIFVFPEEGKKLNNHGETAPAIVVNAWEHIPAYQESGTVNLKVLADGVDNFWLTSIPYSEEKEPRTWHWPARV